MTNSPKHFKVFVINSINLFSIHNQYQTKQTQYKDLTRQIHNNFYNILLKNEYPQFLFVIYWNRKCSWHKYYSLTYNLANRVNIFNQYHNFIKLTSLLKTLDVHIFILLTHTIFCKNFIVRQALGTIYIERFPVWRI